MDWKTNLIKRGYREWLPCEFFRALKQRRDHVFPPIKNLADLHQHVAQYKAPPEFFTSEKQMKLNERAIWNGVDPLIQYFAGALIEELRKYDLPFYVHTAYRSPELQSALKRRGYSQVESGPHQRGAAVDIVHSHYHWADDRRLWLFVGTVGEHIIKQRNLPIEWGGRWKFYDPAHWQLSDWGLMAPYEADDEVFQPYGEVVTKTPKKLYKDNVSYAYQSKKKPSNVYNRDQAFHDAVNAIAKLKFSQLLTLNANLAEHIYETFQYAQIEHAKAQEKAQLEDKPPAVQ